MTQHLFLPIIGPLLGAVLCLALRRRLQAQRLVSLVLTTGLVAYLGLVLWPDLGRGGGYLRLLLGSWPAPFGIVLVADTLSALMLSVTGVTALCVLVYAIGWLGDADQVDHFFPLYLVLLAGVNGAFLTGDIFNLFVCFEVLLVASFGMLVLGGKHAQLEGALKYLAISQVASAMLLVGAGLLYGTTGTLNMADLSVRLALPAVAPYAQVAAMLLLIAFGTKAAIFPLHFWLPASYHTPPTPVSAIFGGLLTKVGVYALYRSYSLLFAQQWPGQRPLLFVLAVCTMVVGVLGAVAQREIKRLLSFHVISQIGYLILALALATPLAMAAGVYFVLHIILVKTALFLVAGLIERATGTVDLYACGGLLTRKPLLAGLFLVNALSLAGMPPLSGFFAKYGLVLAGLQAQAYAPVAAALAVSMLTLFSMVKIWIQGFMKRMPEGVYPQDAVEPLLSAAATALAACALAVAITAGPLWNLAMQAAQQLLHPAGYIRAVLGG